jgi:hypothetical protein
MLHEDTTQRRRRMVLRIGSGFLPRLFGEGLHAYRVTKNPLPMGTEIIGATMSPDLRSVVLLLESPAFPETAEPDPYPEIEPLFTRVDVPDIS